MSHCGWNRQLAASDTQPIPHSLATVVARLLANDAAGRRASGPDDSICFISSDEQRVVPNGTGEGRYSFLSVASSDLPRCPSDRQQITIVLPCRTSGPLPKEIFGLTSKPRRRVRE